MDEGDAADPVVAYERALRRFVEGRGEPALESAYAFGREAFGEDMTILDVVEVHRQAVAQLLDGTASEDGDVVDATFSFLLETLSVFEMTQRGLQEARDDAARERAIALSLQQELLPRELPNVEGLDVAVRYLPGELDTHAGGDWYDVFEVGANRRGLVVGDVTGHGVGAVAAMGRLRMGVLAYARAGGRPAEVVRRIDLLLDQLQTGELASMVCVVIDPDRGRLALTNAGHPAPLMIDPRGDSRLLTGGHSRLLGVRPALARRPQITLPMAVGSHLLLYSDGLIEPRERSGDDGIAHLTNLTHGFDGSAETLCDLVLEAMVPGGANDDICVVAATLTGRPRRRRLRSRVQIPSLAPTWWGRLARR